MTVEHTDRDPLDRDQILPRVARHIPAGAYVNLGIGQPTAFADHLDMDARIRCTPENGMLGMGRAARDDEIDPDLINAGTQPVTETPGATYFHHAISFAMMRGGHPMSPCWGPSRSPSQAISPNGTPARRTQSRRSRARWISRSAPATST